MVDTKDVIQEILDTPVSLKLRNILGTSKELSNGFNNVIKFKNLNIKPPTSLAIHQVYNSAENKNESMEMEDNYEPDYEDEDRPEEKALIKLNLYCNGKPITAVIDTGSQLNIISEEVANAIVQLPINLAKNVAMGDASGNSSKLEGLIKKVPLRCGEVLCNRSKSLYRTKRSTI